MELIFKVGVVWHSGTNYVRPCRDLIVPPPNENMAHGNEPNCSGVFQLPAYAMHAGPIARRNYIYIAGKVYEVIAQEHVPFH